MTKLSEIPNPEALVEILKADGAPSFITLDLEESDGDELVGTIRVGLDKDGKLCEVNA